MDLDAAHWHAKQSRELVQRFADVSMVMVHEAHHETVRNSIASHYAFPVKQAQRHSSESSGIPVQSWRCWGQSVRLHQSLVCWSERRPPGTGISA